MTKLRVYYKSDVYTVMGSGKKDNVDLYLLDIGEAKPKPVPKKDCIPFNDLNIFETHNYQLKEWEPNVDILSWKKLIRMSFDIETTGLNPETDRIIAIGWGAPNIGSYLDINIDEYTLLSNFMKTLAKYKPDILIGYNCYKFDLPFIIKRCEIHNIKHPFKISDKPKILSKAIYNGKPLEVTQVFYKSKHKNVSIIDLFPLVILHDNVTAQLERYNLKYVVLTYKLRDKKRIELSSNEIHKLWSNYLITKNRNDISTIADYLSYDIEDTHLLSEYLLPQIYYQRILLPELNIQEISLMGAASKWNKLLRNYYKTEPVPDNPIKIEGALMVVNPGLYKNCSKIDVSSLYPSIMLKYNIWTKKDKDKYGLSVLQYLTKKRLELKLLSKKGDEEAKLMSDSLKVFINSAYGLLGTSKIPFNDFKEFGKVPAYGREILKFMLNYLENNDAIIVEADTDGIIFSHPEPVMIKEKLQDELPKGINIELEWSNVDVYCIKKKSYILFFPDGSYKANGIYKKRDRCILEKTYPIEYLKSYLSGGIAEANKYHNELIKLILSGKYPIENLSINRTIRVNEKELLKLGSPGDKVNFYQGINGLTNVGDYNPSYYIGKIKLLQSEILNSLGHGQLMLYD